MEGFQQSTLYEMTLADDLIAIPCNHFNIVIEGFAHKSWIFIIPHTIMLVFEGINIEETFVAMDDGNRVKI